MVTVSADGASRRAYWESRRRVGKGERGAFQRVSHATLLFKLVVKGGKRFAKGERNQKEMSGRYRGNSSKGTSVNSTNRALVDNTQSAIETHVSRNSGALSAWCPQYFALFLENRMDTQ